MSKSKSVSYNAVEVSDQDDGEVEYVSDSDDSSSSLSSQKGFCNLSESVLSYAALALCPVVYSMMSVSVKYCADYGYPSMEILAARVIVQVLITLGFMGMQGQSLWVTSEEGSTTYSWALLLLHGVFVAGSTSCSYEGYELIEVGDAITVISSYPVFVALMAWLFLKERLSISYVLALLVSIGGYILIAHPSFIFGGGASSTKGWVLGGYGFCIAHGIFVGFDFVVLRKSKGVLSVGQLLVSFSVISLFLAIISMSTFQYYAAIRTWQEWLALILVGVFGWAGLCLMTYAGQRIQSAVVSLVVSSGDIVFGYVWQVVIFNKKPTGLTIGGVVAVIVGVALVSFEKYRETQRGDFKVIPVSPVEMEQKSMSGDKETTTAGADGDGEMKSNDGTQESAKLKSEDDPAGYKSTEERDAIIDQL